VSLRAEAKDSTAVEALARWGLGARGVLYLLLGALAAAVALGRSGKEANQQGALALLLQDSLGKVLLALIAAGFGAYALWRLSEVAFGVTGKGRKAGPRLLSLARGASYLSLTVSTVTLLLHSGHQQSQSSKQQTYTGRLLQHTGGQLLLGLIGLVAVGIGIGLFVNGVRQKFRKHLALSQMSARTRSVVEKLGTTGTCARGAVFALAGALVVDAAIHRDANESRGLDGALRTLAQQPYGTALLLVAAAGLFCFGLYGLAEARYRKP
jgi:hypothetical protein